ncbi:hypothetical protein [Rhodoplanes elegans]|uniref:hypothetical protein n=1 Tax=Rhodoplanes elegans TaxID=29408 RepID=UPI0011B948B6|nr:hypothetical protein [Rhodoplanes elegans]
MRPLRASLDAAFRRRADNDNRREPCAVRLARRNVLASRTVVECAAGLVTTAREAFFAAEHAWAAERLLDAVGRQDFSGWAAGDEGTSPHRWRLARRRLELHLLAGPTPFEALLRDEFDRLWAEIAAPAAAECAA